jgi:hypothetical protein
MSRSIPKTSFSKNLIDKLFVAIDHMNNLTKRADLYINDKNKVGENITISFNNKHFIFSHIGKK